jgi:choline transport protein
MVQGLAVLTTSYHPKAWQTTLIIWAVLLFTVFINLSASWLLPNFERLVLVLHIAGFFAVLIPLACMGQHNSANEVFTTFLNEGGWQTQGLSFFVGIVGNIFAFAGSDAAVHVCI